MNDTTNKQVNLRRRTVLLGGLAASAAGLLQACGGGAGSASGTEQAGAANANAQSMFAATTGTTVTTPAPIPANQVNLSDFGGVPGASGATIINAFNQAFTRLKSLGGGTLNVAGGVYNLGSFSGGTAIYVTDLQNVLISAYGAQLTITTTAVATPNILIFSNPNNVTVAGLSFKDFGGDPSINWKGAICMAVQSTYARSGFKTVDCVADQVCTFLQAQQPSSYQYTFEGFDIHGTVKNSYYGVNPNFNGSNSKVNLTVQNVRRGFIGYGLRNWDVTVNASADGIALGSNALIEIAADSRGYVDTVKVNLTVTGNMRNYRGLVTCYHQSALGSFQYIRNVKANVTLNNVTEGANGAVFLFPYEAPNSGAFATSTVCSWEQIQVSGSVVGSYSGNMIQNPSLSSATTNSINVGSAIASRQDMSALPNYFHAITQCSV